MQAGRHSETVSLPVSALWWLVARAANISLFLLFACYVERKWLQLAL